MEKLSEKFDEQPMVDRPPVDEEPEEKPPVEEKISTPPKE